MPSMWVSYLAGWGCRGAPPSPPGSERLRTAALYLGRMCVLEWAVPKRRQGSEMREQISKLNYGGTSMSSFYIGDDGRSDSFIYT